MSHRADAPVNPASVMKLVTTYAALDLLGPAYIWTTPVFVDGPVRDGRLDGNLYIKGQGDPTLVSERLWLLMRRVRALGIEPHRRRHRARPQRLCAGADRPRRLRRRAAASLQRRARRLAAELQVGGDDLCRRSRGQSGAHPRQSAAGRRHDSGLRTVVAAATAATTGAPCVPTSPTRRRSGSPAATLPPAWRASGPWPTRPGYAARAVEGMWREVGGQLAGTVREGRWRPRRAAAFEVSSPTLAEVVRDINKYSNNVMAQQLFLSLSLPSQPGQRQVAPRRHPADGRHRSRLRAT